MSYAPGGRRMVSLGKVHAPKPVNLPSQRRENNGNDPNVSIVPRVPSGSSCWNTNDNAHGGPQYSHAGSPAGSGAWGQQAAGPAPPPTSSGQPEALASGGAAWGGAGLPERRACESPARWTGDFPELGKDGEVLKEGAPGPAPEHPRPSSYSAPPYGGHGDYRSGPGDGFPRGEYMGRGPPPLDYYRQEQNSNYRHPPASYDRRYPAPGPYMHPQGGFPPPPPPPPPPIDRQRDRDRDREKAHDIDGLHHRPPYPPQQQHGYGPAYNARWGHSGSAGGGIYGRGPPQNWQGSGRFHSPGRIDYRAGHFSRDNYGSHSMEASGRFECDRSDIRADCRVPNAYPHRGEPHDMQRRDGELPERRGSLDLASRREREPPPTISLHDHGDHDWSKMVEDDDVSRLPTPKFPDTAIDTVESSGNDSGRATNPPTPSPRLSGPPKILTRQSSPGEIAAAAAAGAAAAAAASAPEGEVHSDFVSQSAANNTPEASSETSRDSAQIHQGQSQDKAGTGSGNDISDTPAKASQSAKGVSPQASGNTEFTSTNDQAISVPPSTTQSQVQSPAAMNRPAQESRDAVKKPSVQKSVSQTNVVLVERVSGKPRARDQRPDGGTVEISIDQQKAFMQARAKERAEVKRAEEERQRSGGQVKNHIDLAKMPKSSAQGGASAQEPPHSERGPKHRGNKKDDRERWDHRSHAGDKMSINSQNSNLKAEQNSRDDEVEVRGSSAAGRSAAASGITPAVMVVPRRLDSTQKPVQQTASTAHSVPASVAEQVSNAQQIHHQARQHMMQMIPPTPQQQQQQLLLQQQLLQMQLAQQHGFTMAHAQGRFSAPVGQGMVPPGFSAVPASQASAEGATSSTIPVSDVSGPALPMSIGQGMCMPLPTMMLGPSMPMPMNIAQQLALQQHFQQQQQHALRQTGQQGTQHRAHNNDILPSTSQQLQASLPAESQQPTTGRVSQMQPQHEQNHGVREKQNVQVAEQQEKAEQQQQHHQHVQIVSVNTSTTLGHGQQDKDSTRSVNNAKGRDERAGKTVNAGKRSGGRSTVTMKGGTSADANGQSSGVEKGKKTGDHLQPKNAIKYSGKTKGSEQKQAGTAERKTGSLNEGTHRGGGGKDTKGDGSESRGLTTSVPPGLNSSNANPASFQVQPIPAKPSGKGMRGGGRSGPGRGRGGERGGGHHQPQQKKDPSAQHVQKPDAAGAAKVRTVSSKLKDAVKEVASNNARSDQNENGKAGSSRMGNDGGRGGHSGERGGRTGRGGRRGGRSGQGRGGRGGSTPAASQTASEAVKPS